ncbi:ATP-binding cassette domain-containing protein [Rhodococcus sp. T2V]|uniref:ABC transporter ATP-binding protein n=1 Tax=Rhodococcus sp. T2V TaxID=3034164 RepID=UPI0023E0EFCB|nr:oligopeptide/dipeptide ABC transporter ATP-binding protein [Rhodococcus sp. T2V]MDF3308184.1 ATP-binding cassette domain-containing protein [Rhodococcus sp. T2V]
MTATVGAHQHRTDIVLSVEDLEVEFPSGRSGSTRAVAGISFDVRRGETLGIVGESGCGKSTTARAILQLTRPSKGVIRFEGRDLTMLSHREMRTVRRKLQVVLQDPISSLNPRRKVRDIVREGLSIWDVPDAEMRVRRAMEAVGLDVDSVGDRLPSEFSGGQCQRISIARALALEPEMVICDEPVSALDVSVQAQIVNLLEDLKAQYGLTLLFVSHDLSVIRVISDRVMVMYLGKICEIGPVTELFDNPGHPYTRTLLDALPVPDPDVEWQSAPPVGEVPSVLAPPSGCRFRTRCPRARAVCEAEEPRLTETAAGHLVSCHFPLE